MEESPGMITRAYVVKSLMRNDNGEGHFSPLILHPSEGTTLSTNTIGVENDDPL